MTDKIGALTGAAGGGSGPAGPIGSLLSGLQSPKTIGGLQAGSSFLSALGTMGADQSKASSYDIQASEWGTQAKDEFVMGSSQVSGLKNQYLNAVGGSTAHLGAGGVDVGQGVSQTSRNIIGQNAASAGQVDMLASDIRARRDTINQIGANEASDQESRAANMALIGFGLNMGTKLLTGGLG